MRVFRWSFPAVASEALLFSKLRLYLAVPMSQLEEKDMLR